MTAQENTAAFESWLTTLSRASRSELAHLVVSNPVGSPIGDAAFVALERRIGMNAAFAAVKAERDARTAEWGAWLAETAREVIAGAGAVAA